MKYVKKRPSRQKLSASWRGPNSSEAADSNTVEHGDSRPAARHKDSVGPPANADDDIDIDQPGAGWQRWQVAQRTLRDAHIGQLARVDIVEMLVRRDVRVEKYLGGVDENFANKPLLRKKSQSVVDSGFGNQRCHLIYQGQQRVGGTMLGFAQQNRSDVNALLSRLNSVLPQQPDRGVSV